MKSRSILALCVLAVLVASGNSYAMKYVGGRYNTGNGLQTFAVNAVHNKLYAINGTDILTFALYPDSGCLVTPGDNPAVFAIPVDTRSVPATAGYRTIALDAMKKKLYVGISGAPSYGSIFIFNLDDSGMIIPSSTIYSDTYYQHKYGIANAMSMYLDINHNLLATSGHTCGGLIMSRLGADGMPLQDSGTFYATGATHNYLIYPDFVRGLVYHGVESGGGNWIRIDGSGFPINGTLGGSVGSSSAMVLDSANNRLYWAYGYVLRWKLSDVGTIGSYDTFGSNTSMVDIDPVRRVLMTCGTWNSPTAHLAFHSLDADGKIASLIDSGQVNTSGTTNGLAYEPFYNKVYVSVSANGNLLATYNGPDSSPLTPVKVNNGEATTQSREATLKFQCANPNYMYVSGDLESIGAPVYTLNQWVPVGGTFWRNSGDTMRATTLEVSAVLSSGVGEKTVTVWYCAPTYGTSNINYNGMMSKKSVTITLVESSATVLGISVARIDYSGARVGYSVSDPRARNVNMDIQYRTSENAWSDMTAGTGGDGKTNLSSNQTGVAYAYIWDIEKDVVENAKDVQVRVRANNGDSVGLWTETEKFSVPEWTGSDLRVTNVSIRKPDSSWSYRARLDWTGIDDTTTTYEIQKKTDNGDWGWVTTTSGSLAEVEDLSETPIYSFRVRLRTKEGLYSSYSKTAGIKLTTRKYGTGSVGKSGGKVFIEDFDENGSNNASVEIEEGTFKGDAEVTLERFQENLYEIKAKKSNGFYLARDDFKKPVTLKLSYNKEEVVSRGWKEEDLAVYHFDGRNWNSIGGKVDKTNALVTVKVSHFSLFKVAKNSEKQTISVVPDYLSPNNDGIADALYFYFTSQEMVEKAVISVYDITGKTIRIIKADGSNTLLWDGRNGNGELCETGLYVVVIEADNQKMTETIRLVK